MDIQASIPHRPPFLFVDAVVSCDDKQIVAERTWDPAADFYKGHYPGNPITPGVLLCESVFQTAALLMAERARKGLHAESGNKTVPVIARVENTKFRKMVLPGRKTVITVTLKETINGFYFMSGKVTGPDGKPVLTTDFAITIVDKANIG
jgi:3-hydroxyacyl-[acyl-carrier-protein] dehydratase